MNHSSIRKGNVKYLPTALGMLIASGFLPSVAASSQTSSDNDSRQNDSTTPVFSDLRSLLYRTSALWSNPQWQAFKMLWRKLDSITPGDAGLSSESFAEQANKLRSELSIAFGELREVSEEAGIDSVELALLEMLTFARLDYLSYGSQLMLTRMMPPPVSEQTDDMLSQIEARIDTVRKLREWGLLNSEEMTTAFENMISYIDTYCVLRMISRGVFYSSPVWSYRWPEEVSEIRTAFDSVRTASLADIELNGEAFEGQYLTTLEAFDDLEDALHLTISRLPALNDLLLDLEMF